MYVFVFNILYVFARYSYNTKFLFSIVLLRICKSYDSCMLCKVLSLIIICVKFLFF